MKQDALNRQIWLIDLILQHNENGITLEEIDQKWQSSSLNENGEPLSRTTFNRHKNAIRDVFGIEINYDKKYRYYIENKEDIQNNILQKWILNSFTISNLLQEWKTLYHRILLEDIPSGREFLITTMQAMKNEKQLRFDYHKFQRNDSKNYLLAPYCVKVFNQRWYVIGFCSGEKEIRIFALDRISNLQITNYKFEIPSDFDGEIFFEHSFGIFADRSIQPQKIIIKANEEKTKYLKSLPLHHSQKELKREGEYTFFEYFLRPTYDFRQEILSHGNELEIISPKEFRYQIRDIVKQMYEFYSNSL